MDDTGNEAKSLMCQHVLSKTKNVIMQNTTYFATVHKAAMPNVIIHLMKHDHLSKTWKLKLCNTGIRVRFNFSKMICEFS